MVSTNKNDGRAKAFAFSPAAVQDWRSSAAGNPLRSQNLGRSGTLQCRGEVNKPPLPTRVVTVGN